MVGQLLHLLVFEACSVFTRVKACLLAGCLRNLCTESFDSFIASAAVPIATGWNDKLPDGSNSR
jgi:hypothetical protein